MHLKSETLELWSKNISYSINKIEVFVSMLHKLFHSLTLSHFTIHIPFKLTSKQNKRETEQIIWLMFCTKVHGCVVGLNL